MKTLIKKLPGGEVEFTIEVEVVEQRPFLEDAAKHLGAESSIPGFRPGKASYETVKARFGEMKIIETALAQIVRTTFTQAAKEHDVRTVGMPAIEVKAVAPGNVLIFTARAGVLPQTKLPDWKSMRFDHPPRIIEEKDIDAVLLDVQKMRAKETASPAPATKRDKVVVDMDISLGGVPLEGGAARDHAVYLNEPYYIPGLPEELVGLTAGGQKKFSLKFPDTHYQKHLAGKDADFSVTVKSVFQQELPEMNDEFAGSLGQSSVAELRALIRKNLEAEARAKAEQALEIDLLETIAEKTVFNEIPDVLLAAEKKKMLEELKISLTERKVDVAEYLTNLKKTEADLMNDFTKQAESRVKAALVLKTVAVTESVAITPEELTQEMERVRTLYKDNPNTNERLEDPDVQGYVAGMLLNRKVIQYMKEKTNKPL